MFDEVRSVIPTFPDEYSIIWLCWDLGSANPDAGQHILTFYSVGQKGTFVFESLSLLDTIHIVKARMIIPRRFGKSSEDCRCLGERTCIIPRLYRTQLYLYAVVQCS